MEMHSFPREPIAELNNEFPPYHRLASFMNRDPSYLVFRRFNLLNLRNLLVLQHEIAELEQRLNPLTSSSNISTIPEYKSLMSTIQEKLDLYNRALVAQAQLNKFGNPELTSVSDLRDWAIDHNCVDTVNHLHAMADSSEELLNLSVESVRDEKDWVYRVIERRLWSRFARQLRPVQDETGGTLYLFPDKKIHHVVRAIFTLLTSIILLIPIIILFFVEKGYPSLIVIVVSTALFSLIVAIATRSKNQEIMLTAAALLGKKLDSHEQGSIATCPATVGVTLLTPWNTSQHFNELNQRKPGLKYGSIVRLGPNELSVNCVDNGIRTIYGGGFEKSHWYTNLFLNYGERNMFSMIDSSSHSIRKRLMSNAYSKSFLQASSDLRELSQEIIFGRLLPIIESSAADQRPLDVLDLNLASTMDLMTAYFFGFSNSTNFLQDPNSRREFFNLYHSRKQYIFWPGELFSLLSFLGRFKTLLIPQWIDTANQALEDWCLKMCSSAKSSSSVQPTKESIQTCAVIYNSLSQPLLSSPKTSSAPEHDAIIASEALDQIGAGHETSGITLTYFMHELSQRPSLQSLLRTELLTLSPPIQYPSYITQHSLPSSRSLDTLPLLQATLMETLRLHAPIPGPQPRLTPPTPTALANSPPLPAGVRVSANAHCLHRNPEVFPNPEAWRPERWLDAKKEAQDEMMRWFWAFGSGGRMCIGRHFAMHLKNNRAIIEMKLVIAAIYTSYTTSIVDDTGIEQQDAYTALPRGEKLILEFRRCP
ncbi:hypothetical protein MMC31_000843 [Peltigera leucophlebia]|nr:hypothetical protein [Peltigera leucophlebia]